MTKMGKKKKKGLVAALSVVAVIVLLAAAYGIFCLIIEDDKIWADASINGVNIQGMSKKEAAQTVEQKFEEDYKDTAVTVELDGQQYTMNVFPMLGMDASAEIEKAYEKGHGNLLVRGLEWVEMKRGKAEKLSYDVQPTVAHPDEVEGIVQASGIQDYNSMQDTTYEVTDTGLIVHKGISGTRPDVDALKQQIQTNVTAMNFQDVISCPTAENQLTEPDLPELQARFIPSRSMRRWIRTTDIPLWHRKTEPQWMRTVRKPSMRVQKKIRISRFRLPLPSRRLQPRR